MASTHTLVTHPGVLRGNGFESNCEVEVSEVTRHGLPSAYGKHRIVWVEKSLPEGAYKLFVHGTTVDVRLSNGCWLSPMV